MSACAVSNPTPRLSANRNAAPLLNFITHIDATPHDLEPAEVAEVDAFERAWRPDVSVSVELCRKSRPALPNVLLGLAESLAMPAVGAAAPVLGSLTLPALLVAGLVTFDGVSRLRDGLSSLYWNREPSWNGTRVYDIGPDRRHGRIDSPIREETAVSSPDCGKLTHFLAQSMAACPAQVTAVMMSGHGMGWQGTTGFDLRDLHDSLVAASQQSGRKIDVLVLEACLMSNLESLDALRDTARYAVVSEETMGARGLPWAQIMGNLPANRLSTEQFNQTVVDQSRHARGISTLAVVDLQKVAPLTAAVEHLAHELRRVVASGGGDTVRAAFMRADAFPHGVDPFTRMTFDLRDLSQLCDRVQTRVDDAAVRGAATRVQSALSEAVVGATSTRHYAKDGQINIQGAQPFFKAAPYDEVSNLHEWSALLQELRPFGGQIG